MLAEGHDAPTLLDLSDVLEEQSVTRQFWPEAVEIVDAFPMTPSGKVQQYRLRDSFSS